MDKIWLKDERRDEGWHRVLHHNDPPVSHHGLRNP